MAVRRAPVSTDKRFKSPPAGSDYGPPERWQHSGRMLHPTDRPGVLAARATEEHVLDILGLRRLLSRGQIEAGLKFKADYHAAAIAAQVTRSYSGRITVRDAFRIVRERTDAEEAAYARWKKAVREMGLSYSPAVIEVVCHDKAPLLREVSALQGGLDKLAAWYKIPRQKPLQARAKK